MVAFPAFFAITFPFEVTVATDFFEDDHVTFLVVPVSFKVKDLPT